MENSDSYDRSVGAGCQGDRFSGRCGHRTARSLNFWVNRPQAHATTGSINREGDGSRVWFFRSHSLPGYNRLAWLQGGRNYKFSNDLPFMSVMPTFLNGAQPSIFD